MHTSILLDPVKSATQPTIPSDLTVVFTENHARLLKLARSMVRCPHAAEDVVQDAMLAALKSFGSFEGRSAAATWLHRIVVNTALMHLRRARTRRELGLEDVAAPVAPHADDPAVLAERDDACQRVHRCLAELSSMHRNVVELRDIKGLDTAAVANALGISENAAKIRLHRARRRLRAACEAAPASVRSTWTAQPVRIVPMPRRGAGAARVAG